MEWPLPTAPHHSRILTIHISSLTLFTLAIGIHRAKGDAGARTHNFSRHGLG